MRNLSFIFVVLLSGSNVLAGQQVTLRTKVTCSKTTSEGKQLQVGVVESSGSGLRMLVVQNAKLVFNKQVSTKTLPDRVYFQSRDFNNLNNAPSSLLLQLHKSNGSLVGEFTEVSYLPQIRGGGNMPCRSNGAISLNR
jgi:hypothetical protein